MGITVRLDPADDPEWNAAAWIEYAEVGATLRSGFPLRRIDATHFVGGLFWLQPGMLYRVRVTFSDPDRGPLDGVLLSDIGRTRAEASIPAANRSWHVDPNGSDTEGTGEPSRPYATVARAVSMAEPGDRVVLREGVYHEGGIALPRSGTARAPIVIEGYPGERAVIDGSAQELTTWLPLSDGSYRAYIRIASPHLIAADGQRLYPYASSAELTSLTWGISGFLASGNLLRMKFVDGSDPNAKRIEVSRGNYGFLIDRRDYIILRNITFRGFGRYLPGNRAEALAFKNADDCLVTDCRFILNDLHISVTENTDRLTVQDSEFSDTIFEWPWDAVKAEDILEADGAVRVFSPYTGRGLVIRRNVVHDSFDGMCIAPYSMGPFEALGVTAETDVYENRIYRCCDDGMEVDGEACNVRIWGNTIHDILTGISLAPAYTGPIFCIRNISYGDRVNAGSGRLFKIGRGVSGPMFLFHNTSTSHKGFYLSDGQWSIVTARNNIFVGTIAYALVNDNMTEPVDLDYDNYYRPYGDLGLWRGVRMTSIEDLRTSASQEMNGRNANPQFVDYISGNHSLRSGSPMIDVGLLIPGINHDFAGSGPDVGAVEYGAEYTLTAQVEPVFAGAIAIAPLADRYAGGTIVTLTATPRFGYLFTHWSGDVCREIPAVSIEMTSNKSLSAHFAARLPARHWKMYR